MSHAELLRRHRAVLPSWLALYYQEPIALVDGQGCRVVDAEGRRYLDFFGGILTTMVGYNLPEVVDAVRDQAGRMVHTSTLYLIEPMVELAERIAGLSGIPDAKVFFTNSGTEANEAALLFATTARRSNQVLALRNSYHGRSFAAMGITGNRGWSASSLTPVNVSYVHGGYRYRSPFRELSDRDYVQACVEDLRDVLRTTTSGDVACMIAEPVQGVGGFATPPDGLFGAMKEVLDESGILLVSDEVQTGWGRTGEHFWGIQAHGVVPDAIDLDLRRQPAGHPRRARDPRLPAVPRPPGQRAQGRHQAAPGPRRPGPALRDRRRGARQGPDDRDRAGRAGHQPAQPAGRHARPRGGPPERPAGRQGRPARQRAARRSPAGGHRGRGGRGAGGADRGDHHGGRRTGMTTAHRSTR
jgi:hypothetical protein